MTRQTFQEGLVLEREAGLAKLTIDRPDDANRLSPDVFTRLAALCDALREDREINVLVITGAGALFSMGILNPAIRASFSKDEVVQLVRRANLVFDAIESLPQVVIAAINGKVLTLSAPVTYDHDGARDLDPLL